MLVEAVAVNLHVGMAASFTRAAIGKEYKGRKFKTEKNRDALFWQDTNSNARTGLIAIS